MVGLTPTELESLNELIHIDHFYVKSQQPTCPKQNLSFSDSHKDIHKLSDFNNVQEPQISNFVKSTASKVSQFSCQNAPEVSPQLVTQSDISSTNISFADTVIVKQEPVDTFSECSNETLDSNELIDVLSDVDLEASWSVNFLDNLYFDESDLQENNLIEEAEKSLAYLESTQNIVKLEQPEIDHDTSKYIDFGNFLTSIGSEKEPISPLTQSSDSDFFSEAVSGDVLSPSSDVSLLDDLPWQDNFSELFPDLQ